jgi:Double zinc ribbon
MADDFTIRFPALVCDTCGQAVEEGKKFCSSCGTPVDKSPPPLLLCQHCGADLPPQAVFCGTCGKKVPAPLQAIPGGNNAGTPPLPASHFPPLAVSPSRGSQAPPHDVTPSQAEVPPNSFARRLKLGLGLLAVLGGGVLAGTWLVAPEPSSTTPVASVRDPVDTPPPANAPAPTTVVETKPLSPPPSDIASRFPAEPSTPASPLSKTAAVETPPPPPLSPPETAKSVKAPGVQGQVVTPDGLLPIRVYGEAKTSPERSVELIRDRVEASLGPLRDAYTQALTRSSGLLGMFTLELTVGGDGRVEQAVAHATAFADTTFPPRVQERAQQWRFPPVSGGSVKIFYPLLFLPESLDARAVIALTKELLPGRYKLIAPEPTSVHEEPNEEAETVGTVSAGLKVYIVSSQGDWLGVLSPKGDVGYIKREAIASGLQDAQ